MPKRCRVPNPFYKPKTKQIEIDTIVHIPSDTDDEVEVDIHVQPGPSGIRPTPSRPNVPPERRPTLQPRYSRPRPNVPPQQRPIEPANPGPSVRRPLRPRPNVPNLNLPNPTELQEMVEQMDQRAFENGIRLQSTPTLHPPQHITIGKHNS